MLIRLAFLSFKTFVLNDFAYIIIIIIIIKSERHDNIIV